MDEGGVEMYRDVLLRHAEIVTPNLREAALLCGADVRDIKTHDDMAALADIILGFGPKYVLVKGGHFAEQSLTEYRSPDILAGNGELVVYDADRIATTNDHGTGCSLSAAIAAGLGLGRSVTEATRDAKSFVLAALGGATSWRLGQGHGPIDHLGWGP